VFAIETKNLSKKFGMLVAVNSINLSVKKGEVFGFLGPNGAGKTTTLKMLTTLIVPTSGTALVAGFDIRKQRQHVRENIGVIFQEPSLDTGLTAKENLKFHAAFYNLPSAAATLKIKELLKLVELSERGDEIVKTFSGGMKRRLEVARAIMHEPKILFLDEPTLGLDPQSRAKIWEYLLRLRERKELTIFMTTHYLDEAEICDKVAIIDKGRVIALNSPKTLIAQRRVSTLNEVFLQLTGRDIRDEETAQEIKKNRTWFPGR